MHRWLSLCAVLLLIAAAPATARFLHRGGLGTGGGGGTVLLPLTGGSLVTTNSGTLTFTNAQGWYGYPVNKNGSDAKLQCIALGVAGTSTYCKYNTNLPSPAPTTRCLIDSLTAAGASVAPGGSSIVTSFGTFTWGTAAANGNYNVLRNGSAFSSDLFDGTSNKIILGNDSLPYFAQANGSGATLWYAAADATHVYYVGAADPTAITLSSGQVLNMRFTPKCPAGL